MKKRRYHQSKKDRRHERAGEERHLRRLHRDRMHEREGEERYLREHDIKRGVHGEFEPMHHSRPHHSPMHHSRNAARHHERSMHRSHLMKYDHGHYAGMDPRRRQEMEDAGMIHEDHYAIANMPQNVIMREYPKTAYNEHHLDDTIRGIDHQIDEDSRFEKDEMYPEKY